MTQYRQQQSPAIKTQPRQRRRVSSGEPSRKYRREMATTSMRSTKARLAPQAITGTPQPTTAVRIKSKLEEQLQKKATRQLRKATAGRCCLCSFSPALCYDSDNVHHDGGAEGGRVAGSSRRSLLSLAIYLRITSAPSEIEARSLWRIGGYG